MLIDTIIENFQDYSIKEIHEKLFDFDEVLTRNKYFVERQNYKIKTGKYHDTSFYMMTVCYPKQVPWMLENNPIIVNNPDLKAFLEFCMKRHKLGKMFINRLPKLEI